MTDERGKTIQDSDEIVIETTGEWTYGVFSIEESHSPMTINWKAFRKRAPAKTRVRSVDHDPLDDGLEINTGDGGIVTRHRRKKDDPSAREYGRDQLYCKFDHLEDEWPMHPTQLEYLIDGTWVSYAQLMTGEM
jgi:hypothetical protein